MEVSDQLYATAALPWVKFPGNRCLGESQRRCGRGDKVKNTPALASNRSKALGQAILM